MQICPSCKTARYCTAECKRADWERYMRPSCLQFSHIRGANSPLQRACMAGNVLEVQRLVEVEGMNVNKATSNE